MAEPTAAGRVAVVTGAGSGVGRAAARALLDAGWSVALAGRRADALDATAAVAPAPGAAAGRALVCPTDVTDPEAVDRLFAAAAATFGRIDLLFNNAGGGLAATGFADIDYAQWRQVVEVNLHGMFLCARAAFRAMRDQTPRGGRIINNGSISAHAPRPGAAAYTTTKHAVTGLTKSIALDGRDYDIACGQLDIGNAVTAMGGRMAKGVPQANGEIAVEAVMDVSECARAIVYMASLPLEANVQFLTVMATKMPFVGRG
jgi:NAD(P)-dependent dehydrogenase (short-subunit alcohol dehydrogenase family)